METPTTLRDAIVWFADFEHCREFMVQLRWPDGVVRCPRCSAEKVTWLAKARAWKCYAKHERPTFTLKTGTLFEDSPIPLEKWLPAAWMLFACKNGMSSYELHKDLGVTQKSAWFMLHRLRLAARESGFKKIGGEGEHVEADECFVGGKVRNMHKSRKAKLQTEYGRYGGKTVVLGLLERDGDVRAAVAPTRDHYQVNAHIMDNVVPGSTVFTDEHVAYDGMPKDFTHEVVNKIEGYVKGQIHVNGMENFWSLLKRTLKGTYVSVDPVHLQAYVDEQVLRFNTRDLTDAERFALILRRVVDRRLTYNELTGKTESGPEMRPC
jgi:transposase-like protein